MNSALLAALLLYAAPSYGFVGAVINGAKYAEDRAYQAFMRLKVIEQIRIMKANYDASVRYYKEFKRLNSGRGLLFNVGAELKTGFTQIGRDLDQKINRDYQEFLKDSDRRDTDIDKFFQSINHGIERSIKYTADEMIAAAENRMRGVEIAQSANGLNPKDAANLSAKAGGLQLQVLSQLHEDNLRLIQLQSLILAGDNRRQESESHMIDGLRESLERRGAAGGRR